MQSVTNVLIMMAVVIVVATAVVTAQEQSRESMAVDATATQWSFQLAYDGAFDYRTDEIAPGQPRPTSNKGFFQLRSVALIPKTESFPITLLPRLTLRMVQDQADNFGFASSDLFILSILDNWGTGRWGIRTPVTFPAAEGFGPQVFGYGFAGAIVQRALDDDLFFVVCWSSKSGERTRMVSLGQEVLASIRSWSISLVLGSMSEMVTWWLC